MDKDALTSWIAEQYGISPEYPWDDENAVFRHTANRKWFAVILVVRADRLGLPGENLVDVVNVKADPRLIGSLIGQPGFHKAYHMNKEKWISMRLDGSVPADTLQMLVSMSYDLTGIRPRKKAKAQA